MKINYILLYVIIAIISYSNLFSMEEPQQNWVFIQNVPGAVDKEDPDVDWRIKNEKLELNLNATEAMTQQTFAEIIKEAKDKNLPFLLVKVQSGDESQFIHFFDGSILRTLMARERKFGYMDDPINKEKINNISIYVIGDDGKLRLLTDNVNAKYLNNFVDFKGVTKEFVGGTYVTTYNYDLVPALLVPGIAQVFIANLYQNEFLQTMFHPKFDLEELAAKTEAIKKLQKEEENLNIQLIDLRQQKNRALDVATKNNVNNEIKIIETKIDDIAMQIKSIEDAPEAEKLIQLERLWLSWSLDKFGPENELQKQKAIARVNEIEYKPQYLQD